MNYKKKIEIKKSIYEKELISPTDLESFVIDAIKNERVENRTQNIYEKDTLIMKEFFSKLIDSNGKVIHPKSYMKVVNKLGLTAQYDYLVLKSIIKMSLKKEELFCLSIHPTSLRNSAFLEKVKNILNDNEEVRGKIVFIITEVEYYSNCTKYNYTLQSLRKKRC
ncbi:MAG: EAL domain-containing protein [Sulfurimonas sp.]|nr:EAL domain-containing protein [Sulfurimonas sp.]